MLTKKEKKTPTAEEQLKEIQMMDQDNREIKTRNILNAAEAISELSGAYNARRLFFHMCLDFTSREENGVDDDDTATMVQIFEVLNVL
jgi:hypothetical protein